MQRRTFKFHSCIGFDNISDRNFGLGALFGARAPKWFIFEQIYIYCLNCELFCENMIPGCLHVFLISYTIVVVWVRLGWQLDKWYVKGEVKHSYRPNKKEIISQHPIDQRQLCPKLMWTEFWLKPSFFGVGSRKSAKLFKTGGLLFIHKVFIPSNLFLVLSKSVDFFNSELLHWNFSSFLKGEVVSLYYCGCFLQF